MEWQRVYYKMGIAISSVAHFEMELQRAKVLQHDLIKSYVRLPDLQQKRMVEFAHGIGIPVATHEIFPSSFVGVDNTEHTARHEPPRLLAEEATLQRSYEDVMQLFGKSGRYLCRDDLGQRRTAALRRRPGLKNDPRFTLYPEWMQQQVAQLRRSEGAPGGGPDMAARQDDHGRHARRRRDRGRHRHAERDQPARRAHRPTSRPGMTPFEALKAATVNPARALGAGRRHDRGRQARRPHHRRRRSARRTSPTRTRFERVIANGRVLRAGRARSSAARRRSPDHGKPRDDHQLEVVG